MVVVGVVTIPKYYSPRGNNLVMLGLIYIVDHITVIRRPSDGLTILVPLIG